MDKKTLLGGLLANGFLVIAYLMSVLGLPNQVLFLMAGLFIMGFFVLPVFLLFSNKQTPQNRKLNSLFTLSSFIIIPVLFLFFQDANHLPYSLSLTLLALTGFYILWYFINALRNGILVWNKVSFFHIWLVFLVLFISCLPIEFQLADKNFNPKISSPTYSKGQGSLIYFDGGHHNFHTLDSRLFATGELLEKDGYQVQSFNEQVSLKKLAECDIFLISNALYENNQENWGTPIYSAFTHTEVAVIKQWVHQGGALFLIADHSPFPAAINNLASQFGFEFEDGYARNIGSNTDYFTRNSNSLVSNAITNGRNLNERVDSVLTFTGSAIKIPADATPILLFDSNWVSIKSPIQGDLKDQNLIFIQGYAQGAFKTYGKGRIVVFGEAMMFTAQLGAGLSWMKMGMNSESCPNNYQLLLNSVHWLDGLIDD